MPVSEIPALSAEKGGFRHGIAMHIITVIDMSLWGGEGLRHATLGKNLRHVPLRCYFLYFEITVNGK